MKRTIASLLACMLLIPGMLIYASAEEYKFVPPDLSAADWNFQYDDSKVYLPVIQVGIVSTDMPIEGGLGPVEDPFTDYSGGPFVDFEEVEMWTYTLTDPPRGDTVSGDKLISDLQLDKDIYFCSCMYNVTFDWDITQHELISLAHFFATDPRLWWHFIGGADTNEYSVYVSLVGKEVETQNWDDFEKYRTDEKYFFREDKLLVDVDLTCVSAGYPWSEEDFPELTDLKGVEVGNLYTYNGCFRRRLTLTFNTPGRETLEDAMQKLGRRYEFNKVYFECGVAIFDPEPILPPDPVDTTDETTVPVTETTDTQTTEPAAETTVTPEKPTSPPTGDAGVYAACVLAAAAIGVVGVVVYRRRRAV